MYRKPSSSRWSGRKRKEVLSINMISLPLADFRHVTHIGNDAHADSFGDLSFLKMGHGLLLQSSQSEQNLFMACSPPPKPPRLNLDEPEGSEGSESPEWGSQKRKKCSSMPLLDSDDGEVEIEQAYQKEIVFNKNFKPKQDNTDTETAEEQKDNSETKDEDSGFSFSLDLGPSILDDVLQVMDKLHS